jgi:hypothetical protein
MLYGLFEGESTGNRSRKRRPRTRSLTRRECTVEDAFKESCVNARTPSLTRRTSVHLARRLRLAMPLAWG